jgi:hypothetical protein
MKDRNKETKIMKRKYGKEERQDGNKEGRWKEKV